MHEAKLVLVALADGFYLASIGVSFKATSQGPYAPQSNEIQGLW